MKPHSQPTANGALIFSSYASRSIADASALYSYTDDQKNTTLSRLDKISSAFLLGHGGVDPTAREHLSSEPVDRRLVQE